MHIVASRLGTFYLYYKVIRLLFPETLFQNDFTVYVLYVSFQFSF